MLHTSASAAKVWDTAGSTLTNSQIRCAYFTYDFNADSNCSSSNLMLIHLSFVLFYLSLLLFDCYELCFVEEIPVPWVTGFWKCSRASFLEFEHSLIYHLALSLKFFLRCGTQTQMLHPFVFNSSSYALTWIECLSFSECCRFSFVSASRFDCAYF